MKKISAEELRNYREKEHEKSYLLIDVRQPVEYEDSHIPGSILLPLNEFEEQVEELPEKNIIFYCRNGTRSRAAALTADFFNEAGKDIYNLEGGMLSWNGITINGIPSFKTFDLGKRPNEILLDAMNLEKGALRFYEYTLKYCNRMNCTTGQYLSSRDHTDKQSFSKKTACTNECSPNRENILCHESFNKVIQQVKDGEVGHAKIIYSYLHKIVPGISSFDEVYKKLDGDILEDGSSLDEMVKLLQRRSEQLKNLQREDRAKNSYLQNRDSDQIIDILEIAISMEYRAFDLYRVLSERIFDAKELQDAFYSLSQAEKQHMNILVAMFEQLGVSPR